MLGLAAVTTCFGQSTYGNNITSSRLSNSSGTVIYPTNGNYSGNIAPISWSTRPEFYDHTGAAVRHGRAGVNGFECTITQLEVDLHYCFYTGRRRQNYNWYKLVRLLTHFTVVAPVLRGFGYTDKPPAAMGYDSQTNAEDVAALMSSLGHDTFHVHGEDRGAEFAYAVAGLYLSRVLTLSFCEMLLSGVSLDAWS